MCASARLPVLSCAEAAAAEAAFIAGDAALSWKLMNLAARGVADEALALLGRKPKRILVLAGKGNNGADAFLAALDCARRGTEIVAVFAEGGPARAQAQRAWAARKPGVRIGVVAAANLRLLAAHEFCLIFDGILGQGFHAPLSTELRAFLLTTEALRGLRISVDLPSGLGDDATSPAFRADLTVSIGCLKRPLLSPKSARFVGRLRVLDIGLPLGETEEACVTAESLAPLRRPRRARSDKRNQGKLLIVGGSDRMPGAVLMNTAAALRAGAALVTTCLPESVRAKAAVAYPEAMWSGLRTGSDGCVASDNLKEVRGLLTDKDTLLIGSGMGEKSAKLIGAICARCSTDLVLDAEALRPSVITASKQTKVRVLLPHAGEFKRLSGRVATIAAAFWPKPVIVRLSDFKSNEYRKLIGGSRYEPEEENPMLGFRGAARYVSADFGEAFAMECEALKRVRQEMGLSNVQIMVPFVRTLEQARKVTELLARQGLERGKDGLQLVMMCEIPSNAILATEFLQYFDGFSIGSNDLTQLTLGLDRDSGMELLAADFDERDPAVQAMIRMSIKACLAQGKYVGICGQGPSDHPDFARWLVDEGISSISLNPDSVIATWQELAKE